MILKKGDIFVFEGSKFKIYLIDESHKVYFCHKYKGKHKYHFNFWYDKTGAPEKLVPLGI